MSCPSSPNISKLRGHSKMGEMGWESNFNLLVEVGQVKGKPLPLGNFMEQVVAHLLCVVTGMCLLGVAKLNGEVLMEFYPNEGIVGISQEIQKMATWEDLSVEATCLILGKRQLIQITRERDEGRRKQESIEDEQHLIRQEQEEHRKQFTQLLARIKSMVSHSPARTDSTLQVEGAAYLTPQNSGCQPPLHPL